jgi:hypothetical protein
MTPNLSTGAAPTCAPSTTTSASLEQKLTTLRLGRIRQVYAAWAQQAAQEQLSYVDFREELVTEEVLGRQEHRLQRHLREAGFPFPATIEQFDCTLRPELKRTVMLRYFDSSFVTGAGALLRMGASGLGPAGWARRIWPSPSAPRWSSSATASASPPPSSSPTPSWPPVAAWRSPASSTRCAPVNC